MITMGNLFWINKADMFIPSPRLGDTGSQGAKVYVLRGQEPTIEFGFHVWALAGAFSTSAVKTVHLMNKLFLTNVEGDVAKFDLVSIVCKISYGYCEMLI